MRRYGAVRRCIGLALGDLRSTMIKLLAATCYSRLALLERSLDEPLPELEGPLALEFGILAPAEADEYVALVPGASAAHVRRRLGSGDVCFTVRRAGRLVAVSWAVTGAFRVPYLRGTLSLSPGEALVEGAYVAPELRGNKVAPRGGHYRLSWLRAAGYRRVVAAVLPENTAAFKAPAKLGYRRTGTAHGIGLGPFRWVLVTGRPGGADRRNARIIARSSWR